MARESSTGSDTETGVVTVGDVRDGTGSSMEGESISPHEEVEIRARVRERLFKEEEESRQVQEARKEERERQAQIERLRWQVIEEETEQFYRKLGRKKYVSSSGEVKWLTPEEFEARRARRSRLRSKSRRSSRRWRAGDVIQAQLRTIAASFVVSLVVLLIITIVIFAVEFV